MPTVPESEIRPDDEAAFQHALLVLLVVGVAVPLARELLAGRAAADRPNPRRAVLLRRNPFARHGGRDPRARQVSQVFHGTPSEVATLSPAERRPLPAEVVVLGELESVVYKPDAHSRRGDASWEHVSGDRGLLQPADAAKPLLVADPRDGRPQIVLGRSRMKLEPTHGLVG